MHTLPDLDQNYILIATSNSKEKNAIRSKLKYKKRIQLQPELNVCVGIIENFFVIHLHGSSGGSTDNSIGKILNYCLLRNMLPKPSIIFLVGFCWGNPRVVELKDTIICTEIESSNQTRFYTNNTEFRSQNIQSILNMPSYFEELLGEYPTLKNKRLISFDCFLSNTEQRNLLISSRPDIGGGEMEGWAFISSLNPMPWLILKSVSDLGDNSTTREEQEECAHLSANYISVITKHLLKENTISIELFEQRPDFINFLMDNEIKISSSELPSDKYSLNDYLNKYIHPLLKAKMDNYDYIQHDSNLVKYFCILILEMIQNSIIHGKSQEISILFNYNIIKYKDNCSYHDPNISTENDGGGKNAWRYIKKNYVENNIITYDYKENKYQFKFNNIESLDAISNECKIDYNLPIQPSNSCFISLIDLSKYSMGSINPHLIIICKKQLEDGKYIYIKVNNEIHISIFQELKIQFPEKVRFFF